MMQTVFVACDRDNFKSSARKTITAMSRAYMPGTKVKTVFAGDSCLYMLWIVTLTGVELLTDGTLPN